MPTATTFAIYWITTVNLAEAFPVNKNASLNILQAKVLMNASRTQRTFLLSVGRGAQSLTTILVFALLVRWLSKSEFAALRQVIFVSAMVTGLTSSGMPQALLYYVPLQKTETRPILTGNLLVLGLIGLLYFVAIRFFGAAFLSELFHHPETRALFLLFATYPLFALLTANLGPFLMAIHRPDVFVKFQVVSQLLLLLFLSTTAHYHPNPPSILRAWLLVSGCNALAAVTIIFRFTSGSRWLPKKEDLLERISFSIKTGVSNALGALSRNLDLVIVSALCSNIIFADYSIGATELPLVPLLYQAIQGVLLPEFSLWYQQGRYQEIAKVWTRASEKLSGTTFLLFGLLFILAPDLIPLVFTSDYENAVQVFRIYLLLLPLRAVNFTPIFLAANKGSLLIKRAGISLLLNLLLSYWLVSRIGYLGACISTVLCILGWAIPYSAWICSTLLCTRIRDLFPWGDWAKLSAVTLTGILMTQFITLRIDHQLLRMLVSVLTYSLSTFFFSLLLGLKPWTPIFDLYHSRQTTSEKS